jgi:hypothetical protein
MTNITEATHRKQITQITFLVTSNNTSTSEIHVNTFSSNSTSECIVQQGEHCIVDVTQAAYHVAGPNHWPSKSDHSGVEFASAVFNITLFPHQVWIEVAPIVPFFGYCRQKKIRMLRGRKR